MKKSIDFFGRIVGSEGVSDRKKGTAYHNLGQSYADQGNNALAEKYYLRSIAWNEKIDRKKVGVYQHDRSC